MDCEAPKVPENFKKTLCVLSGKALRFSGSQLSLFRTKQLEELFLRSSAADKCGPAFFLPILWRHSLKIIVPGAKCSLQGSMPGMHSIFRDIVEHMKLSEMKERWISLLTWRTQRTNPGDLSSQGKPRGQRWLDYHQVPALAPQIPMDSRVDLSRAESQG